MTLIVSTHQTENALITGATKGMGRAIAVAFAGLGINVAVCSRNQADLEALAAEISAINPDVKVFTQVADGSKKDQLLNFASAAQQALGYISIVVNNLGIFAPLSILDDADDTFETQMNTNFMPAYHLYRHFGKTMMEAKRGHIFNICSVASLQPIPPAGSYSISKYALLGLNKIMRQEMQPHGVKVTAIIPGSTLTASWDGAQVNKDDFVLPEDIAAAVVTCFTMSTGANVDELVVRPKGGQV